MMQTLDEKLFEYPVLEFGNGDSMVVSKPDLFLAKNISLDNLIGNVYNTSSRPGDLSVTFHGYKKADERFPQDICGRQELTNLLGVQTTFMPLRTSSRFNRDQRATNVFVNVDRREPSLRFDPTRNK